MTMHLVVDCRETALIARCRALLLLEEDAAAKAIRLVVRSLPLGDVLLERRADDDGGDGDGGTPVLLIERKALPDLLASITDGRYAEQSFRLAHHPRLAPHNIVYLLEGSIAALPRAADRQRCFSALASCQYFKGFSTCRTESLDDTAHYLLATAAKLGADLRKGKTAAVGGAGADAPPTAPHPTAHGGYASVVHSVKKDNLTADNIGVVFLSQVPGFSAASAQCVMDAVPGRSLRALLEGGDGLGSKEGRDRLRALPLGPQKRRLGDAAVARLCAFLRPDVDPAADKPPPGRKRGEKKSSSSSSRAEAVVPATEVGVAAPPAKKARRKQTAATLLATPTSSVFPHDDDGTVVLG